MHPALTLALFALTALPPQSEEELRQEADFIAIGVVERITQDKRRGGPEADHTYTAWLKLEKIEKAPGTKEAQTATVHFRRTGERPPGWTGPVGQESFFKKGDRVRIFATLEGKSKRLHLLEPNGWEPVEPEAKKP